MACIVEVAVMARTLEMIYRSKEGHDELIEWWAHELGRFESPCGEVEVQTSFGATHVLETGEEGAPPLLFLPGTNSTPVHYRTLIEPLSQHYRFFGANLLGQPGKSSTKRPPFSDRNAYSSWGGQLLDELKLDGVVLAGHSFGGWVAMAIAAAHPSRIHGVVLIDPGGIIKLRVAAHTIVPSMAWLFFPSDRNSRKLLALMHEPGTALEDAEVHWMTLVARHVKSSFAPPPLPDETLQSIEAPVLLVSGEKDVFLPGPNLEAGARKRLPTLRDTLIVPGAGHNLVHDRPGFVAEEVIRFIEEI